MEVHRWILRISKQACQCASDQMLGLACIQILKVKYWKAYQMDSPIKIGHYS